MANDQLKRYFLPGARHTDLQLLALIPRFIRPPDKDMHLRPIIWLTEGLKTYVLSLYSHTAWGVVYFILDALEDAPTYLKVEQNTAIAEYAWLRKQKDLNANPESPHLLRMYFELFDRMFFARALTTQPLCLVEMVLLTTWETDGDCTTHRDADFASLPPQYEIRIRIANIKIRSDLPGPDKRLNYYLGVLLHECIHAIFGLYVCYKCHDCQAAALSEEAEGAKGHGAAFAAVGRKIEALTAILEGGLISIPTGIVPGQQDTGMAPPCGRGIPMPFCCGTRKIEKFQSPFSTEPPRSC